MSATRGNRGSRAAAPQTQTEDLDNSAGRQDNPSESRRAPGGFTGLSERMATPFDRRGAGEGITKIVTALKEACGDKVGQYRFTVLDKNSSGAACSAILVSAETTEKDGSNSAVVHTLLVENSIDGELLPRTETINGRSVEIRLVTSDVYDDWYWNRVHDITAGQHLVSNVYEAGQNIISREMSPDDKEQIKVLMYFAAIAIKAVADRVAGQPQEMFSVRELQTNDRLLGRFNISPSQPETPAGLPIASDISVLISGASPNDGQRGMGVTGQRDIVLVDTMMNLIYEPARPAGRGEIQETQCETPEIIMTNVETRLGMPSVGMILLGIHGMVALAKGNVWPMAYRPRVAAQDNLRDLSAIGFDCPGLTNNDDVPKRVPDFTSNSFSMKDFSDMVEFAIRRDPIFSIDIDEIGPLSMLTGVFEAAAKRNTKAEQVIIDAADFLTDGAFSECYNGGPLIRERFERISLGYMTNREGQRVDIRRLNYLAFLNICGADDMAAVEDFDATWSTNSDLALRVARREELQLAVRPDIVFKGYARRYTFDEALIVGLEEAFQRTEHAITWTDMPQDMATSGRRRAGAMADYAVDSRRLGSLYTGRQRDTSSVSGRRDTWGRR